MYIKWPLQGADSDTVGSGPETEGPVGCDEMMGTVHVSRGPRASGSMVICSPA